jgi:hypothetical protein
MAGVYVTGSYAYTASHRGGLRVLDVSTPATPSLISSYAPPSGFDIDVQGSYVYLASYEQYRSGLAIFDVSNPARPQLAGSYPLDKEPSVIKVVGNHAYVGGQSFVCNIYIGNPASPVLVYCHEYSRFWATDFFASGSTLFIANSGDGFSGHDITVLDISNPTIFNEMISLNTIGVERGIFGSSGRLYVAASGLRVIDLNSTMPTTIGEINFNYADDVYVSNNHAYVTSDVYGLRILNISNPMNPTQVSVYNTPGHANEVVVVDNYAYVADGGGGLRVIDISNPTEPVNIGWFTVPGRYSADVEVSNGYIYLPISGVGLYILRYKATPGDLNGDDVLDLKDANIALKIVVGKKQSIVPGSAVRNNGQIGTFEIPYIINAMTKETTP